MSGFFLCAIIGIFTTPSMVQQRLSAIELKPSDVFWENILQLEQLVRHNGSIRTLERADLVEFLKSLTTNPSRQQTTSSIDIRSQK